jgi:hypothetical protein
MAAWFVSRKIGAGRASYSRSGALAEINQMRKFSKKHRA